MEPNWSKEYKATSNGSQIRITGTPVLTPDAKYRWLRVTDELVLLGRVREQGPPSLEDIDF